ncbi:MAG: hypothetical protein ACOCP4_03370 [Candidatus Woesearchaeota archaeon]
MKLIKYYISTGEKENYYTLRALYQDSMYSKSERGVQETQKITRDYHIQNLSIEREKAKQKAFEITGQNLEIDFDTQEIGQKRDLGNIDWSILRSGKYQGKNIHELLEIDREYLIWLCMNMDHSDLYKQTIELAYPFVAKDIQKIKDQQELEKQKIKDKSENIKDVFLEVISVLENKSNYPGDFCSNMAMELKNGIMPKGRTLDIVSDIYAKSFGRRNSKKYINAEENFWELVEKIENDQKCSDDNSPAI